MSRLTDALDAHSYAALGGEWDDPTDDEHDTADRRRNDENEARE